MYTFSPKSKSATEVGAKKPFYGLIPE